MTLALPSLRVVEQTTMSALSIWETCLVAAAKFVKRITLAGRRGGPAQQSVGLSAKSPAPDQRSDTATVNHAMCRPSLAMQMPAPARLRQLGALLTRSVRRNPCLTVNA